MANPLRFNILTKLNLALQGITTDNGYRNTVESVEIAGRAWDESETVDRPWIGIVPQEEIITDRPGYTEIDWRIALIAHVTPASRTALFVSKACAEITNDIRYCLYDNQDLGLDDVISISLIRRQGSEGSPQAALENVASVELTISIKFIEEIDER